jgi:Carbohydrate-selective porin, OprB family/S-layer homology domain
MLNIIMPAPMAQVTSVSQLDDVKATDWAFPALQSLVERYGCITGYPDRTYRGDRSLSRNEFAAGLNACLEQINQMIKTSTKDSLATKEDLETIQKLQIEFATELTTLNQRIDRLETGTDDRLGRQQFSTTTKLFGQVIMSLQSRSPNRADLNPRNGILDTTDPATALTFGYNTQLSLFTQFSNRSIFLLGLQAGNLSTAASNQNPPYFLNDTYTRLAYESNTNNQIILSDATYRFLATDRLSVIAGAIGVNPVSVFRGPNRYEGASSGPISSFAQRNPILNLGGQAGVGIDWQLSDRASLQAVYSAGSGANPASNPVAGAGLFNGQNTIGVQLAAIPLPRVDWTVYYLNQYNPSSQLGTGVGDDLIGFIGARFKTSAIGSTISWRVNPRLTLGGWLGYTNSTIRVPGFTGGVETFNWMSFINFPDLLSRGNLGGIYFGQPPRITRSDLALNGLPTLNIPSTISGLNGIAGGQPDATYHLETFYRWQVNPRMSITPGIIVLFNPVQTRSSDNIVVGTVRSTFSF